MSRIIAIVLCAACAWSCNTQSTASGIGRPAWDAPEFAMPNGVYISEVYVPADGSGAFVELYNPTAESERSLAGFSLCSPQGCESLSMTLGAGSRLASENIATLMLRPDFGVVTLENPDGQVQDLFGWGCDPQMLDPDKTARAFVMGVHEPGTFVALPYGFEGSTSMAREGLERGCAEPSGGVEATIDAGLCAVQTVCDLGALGLAIHEVLPDLTGSGSGWVEITNTTGEAFDASMFRVCAFPSCALLPLGTVIESGAQARVAFGEQVDESVALGANPPGASGAVAIMAPGSADYRASIFVDFMQYGLLVSGQAEEAVAQCVWSDADAVVSAPTAEGESLIRVNDNQDAASYETSSEVIGAAGDESAEG